jgi:hypothetical protein
VDDLFPTIGPGARAPQTYLEFWNLLRRSPKYQYYRAHQLVLLESYQKIPASKKDVAISLPTGTGKTVIALSIARFAQLHKRQRVLYLCPTRQLAQQVLDQAKALGVPGVSLMGPWGQVAPEAKSNYHSGEAIGVASYSSMFNASPQVGTPSILILDDIHAAGEQISAPWSLSIRRENESELFDEMLRVIREQNPTLGVVGTAAGDPTLTDLLKARDWLMVVDTVRELVKRHIGEHADCQLRWSWGTLYGKLESTFCFVSGDTILVRPWVPPTFELTEFDGCARRIHFSATLDRWGLLEQIAGVESAHALTLPDKDVPVPGRRLLLDLNRLLPAISDEARIVDLVARGGRVLVLCRYRWEQEKVIEALVATSYDGEILGAGGLEEDISLFRKSKNAVLVLANRYDGIDLGDGVCRTMVIWRLPLSINLQEKFVTDIWKLRKLAEFRAKQRIHQGIGRCTRTDSDCVVIGLVGEDLVEFLLRPDIQLSLPPRIRAEIELCRGAGDPAKLDALIEACLLQSTNWERACDQMDSLATTLPDAVQLEEDVQKINKREGSFSRLTWTRNFSAASESAQHVAQEFVKAQSDSNAAPWFYLASVADDVNQFVATGSPYSSRGSQMLTEANSRAEGRTWFGELSTTLDPVIVPSVTSAQLDGLVHFLKTYPTQTMRISEFLQDALRKIESGTDTELKFGLRSLGTSLGLDAPVLKRDGAPDGVWALEGKAIMIFEAKTEKLRTSPLSIAEVRQLISQPTEVAANDGVHVSAGLLPICVTDAEEIAKEEAHALDHFDVLRPAVLLEFAIKWFGRLESLHRRSGASDENLRRLAQAALVQMRASTTTLHTSLGVVRARKLLKVAE